jgi:hypothetical protein
MDCATYPDQPAVCPPNTSYPVTTIGYKKVAGSKCVGGVSMLPAPNQTRMCPNPPSPPPAPTPSGPTPTSLIPEAINITPVCTLDLQLNLFSLIFFLFFVVAYYTRSLTIFLLSLFFCNLQQLPSSSFSPGFVAVMISVGTLFHITTSILFFFSLIY